MEDFLNHAAKAVGRLFVAGAFVLCLETGFTTDLVAGNCAVPPDGLLANWRGEGNANDSFGANNGTMMNGATFAPGMVGQGFSLNGTNAYVLIPNAAALNLTNEFTIEFWYKDMGSSAASHTLVSKFSTAGYQPVNYSIAIDLNSHLVEAIVNDTHAGSQYCLSTPVPTAGVFHHIAASFRQLPDLDTVEMKTYADGLLLQTFVGETSLAETLSTAPVTIGSAGPNAQFFKGIIDEVCIYKRALTLPEIQAIYLAGSAGKCLGTNAPYLYLSPSDTVALVGDTVTFTSAVGGTQPIHYQWTLNNTNVPGATNYSLTVTNVQLTNAGKYAVQLTNVAGGIASAPADLLVPVEDQTEPEFDHWMALNQYPGVQLAQTFKPGISGRLVRMDLSGVGTYGYPITATIVDTVNGQPGTNVLGRGLVPDLDTHPQALFTNSLVYLDAGTLYAVILNTDAPANLSYYYDFRIGWNDSYPAGSLWQLSPPLNTWQIASDSFTSTPVDLVFFTFMLPGIPPIRLTSPADGSQWQTADVLPLTAVISPSNATPSAVSFYNGTNLLGVVSQAPYTLSWTNPPAGALALSATASLGTGPVTSAVVNISVVATQPPNDRFANRIALVGDYCQTLVTNEYGTLETGEVRPIPYSSGQSVWWTWTAPRTASVTLAITDDTATNAVLGVYSGAAVDTMVMLASGVGSCNFQATSNQTYQIVVDSLNGSLVGSPLVLAVSDVELTAPAAGSVYTAPTTLNLQAARTSTSRTLDHVDFLQGTNLLGTVSSPPYNLSAPCPDPGNLSLWARAWDTQGIATISQPVAVTVHPQNDNFAQAIVITGYDTNIQTFNSAGTIQVGEPHWADNQGGHSIWYRWVAPSDGICTISGSGAGFGLLLGVYAGPNVSQLTTVAVNAFSEAAVVFPATAGSTYNISVDGFFGEQGALDWSLALEPPNDNFTNRTQIIGAQNAMPATLTGANLEAGESNYVSNPNAGSVWFTWTAPGSAQTTISVAPADIPVGLMIFTGSSLTNLQLVTNSGAAWSTNATVTFQAQQGVAYQIMLVGDPTAQSSLTLVLDSQVLHFISPGDVSTYPAPANILLSVSQDGVVETPAEVDYYANNTLVGTSTNAPFSFDWSGVGAGTYMLQASAISEDGVTNSSLPITILVYTNEDIPTPRIFAGPYANRSFVVNAVGAVYQLGFPPFVPPTGGLPHSNAAPPQVDGFHPQLLNWPAGKTARWQKIDNGWALTTTGQLYQEGVTSIPPPAGVNRWINFVNGWAFGDNGNIYGSGTTLLSFAVTGIAWQDGGAGYDSTVTLSQDGRAFAQFTGTYGEAESSQFNLPAGVTHWTGIGIAVHFAVLKGDDGNLYQTTTNPPALVPFPTGVTSWEAFVVGGFHVMAIGSDGQLYTWGRNAEGELGIGTAGADQPPAQKVTPPAGVTAWTAVAAGYMHSLAIGSDGGLYAWGANDNGQLGIGPLPSPQSPTRVTSLGPLWGIPIISTTGQTLRLPDGSFRLHFITDLNRVYQIQYTDDLQHWKIASPTILGTGGFVDWIDNGPPNTDTPPTATPTRAYRVTFGY